LVGVFAALCIGPPIIALLAFVGAQGSPIFGFFTFFVMAFGLGLPYLILGTFSGLMGRMPQSGLWMVWIKKVFGVVLVGVALFYLALAFDPGYSMYAVLATVITGGIYLGFIEQSGNQKERISLAEIRHRNYRTDCRIPTVSEPAEKGGQWQKYDAQLIKQTDKPIILDFYADWCIPCIELDRKTFTDNRVINRTESFLRMKVDLTHFDSKRAEKLRQQYKIAGVPTILFLDSEGNEIKNSRVIGFLNANKFLERLEKVEQVVSKAN
jgi:thiol:disulfide interchange protein DsbD